MTATRNPYGLKPGARYQIDREYRDLPIGTVFTYIGSVDYLDWFQRVVEIDGQQIRVSYGLPDYCEAVGP